MADVLQYLDDIIMEGEKQNPTIVEAVDINGQTLTINLSELVYNKNLT